MAIIILSYRESYACNCRRDWYCACRKVDSDLEFVEVDTNEEAAKYIANRISDCPECSFSNVLFENWEDVSAVASYMDFDGEQAEKSVKIPHKDWEGFADSSFDTVEEYERELERREELCTSIQTLVRTLLKEKADEAARKEAAERAIKRNRAQAQQDARDKAEYERLQKKFTPE